MKLELESLGSLENQTTALQVLNLNFERIGAALENTFSRDGEAPNYIDNDVDVNSHRVINLGAPQSGSDAARYVDVVEALAADGLTAIPNMAGNQAKIMGNDGSILVWRSITEFPGLGDLKSINNLSELTDKAAARSNLGLGTSATFNVGTSGNNIPTLSGVNTWSGSQTYQGGFSLQGSADYTLDTDSGLLSSQSIGFRGAPAAVVDVDYVFIPNDSGRCKIHTSPNPHVYTLPTNATAAIPVGHAFLVINAGSGNLALSPAPGVTLRKAGGGTTGPVVIPQWSVYTAIKYETNTWLAVGA